MPNEKVQREKFLGCRLLIPGIQDLICGWSTAMGGEKTARWVLWNHRFAVILIAN